MATAGSQHEKEQVGVVGVPRVLHPHCSCQHRTEEAGVCSSSGGQAGLEEPLRSCQGLGENPGAREAPKEEEEEERENSLLDLEVSRCAAST